jgi:hypothetical protein
MAALRQRQGRCRTERLLGKLKAALRACDEAAGGNLQPRLRTDRTEDFRPLAKCCSQAGLHSR